MRFKTIVAILQNEQDAERVLDCAIPLGNRFQSHLIGIHAEALPVPYTSATGFPDTEFLQVSADMNRERADRLHGVFLKHIENWDFPSNGVASRAFRATAPSAVFPACARPI